MKDVNKFPKIRAFREVIRYAREHNLGNVEIEYRGTVKLHGSNAGVQVGPGNEYLPQSRNRMLSLDHDNAAFAAFALKNRQTIAHACEKIISNLQLGNVKSAILFGEWIGPGVQKTVAITKLPTRQWVLFGLKIMYEDGTDAFIDFTDVPADNLPNLSDIGVYSIHDIQTYSIRVNLLDDASCAAAAAAVNQLTIDVETECPWAKRFGIEGIGEGIVWKPVGSHHSNIEMWFKTKGGLHQQGGALKVVATLSAEQYIDISSFVDRVICDERVQQAAAYITDLHGSPSMKFTADYIKWIKADILSEHADELIASSFTWDNVEKAITTRAVAMWKNIC